MDIDEKKRILTNHLATYEEFTTLKRVDKYINTLLFGGRAKNTVSWSTYAKYNKIFCKDKKNNSSALNNILLQMYMASCGKCGKWKRLDSFCVNNTNTIGVNSWCRDCFSIYQKKEPHRWRYYAANRRAKTILRTPSWANLEKIEDMYKNCPAGYQVDHVVPLSGKLVSGLHVEYNLQYLTIEDNNKKSNKFNIN